MDLDQIEAARTLAAAKAALERWQGHMRRGAQLRNETEYAAALALVPGLPTPKPFLVKTLRGLADLYASEKRLEDAGALFARLSREATQHSLSFLRDHLALLFRLAEQRLAAGDLPGASSAMEEAGNVLTRSADKALLARQACDGYALASEAFERARQALPAKLYAMRSLEQAVLAGEPGRPAPLLRRLAQLSFQRRDAARALGWLEPLLTLEGQGAAQAAAAAQALGQSAAAAGRLEDAGAYFRSAEAWLGASGSPALADLYLAWSFWLPRDEAVAKARVALDLRQTFLGSGNPRTEEAGRVLRSLEQGTFSQAAAATATGGAAVEGGPWRPWDGGSSFGAVEGSGQAGEVKRLQRRLALLVHPDRAADAADAKRRHEWMLKVNEASARGDVFALRTLMREVLAALAGKVEEA